VHLVLYCLQLVTIVFLRIYLPWQNGKKRRDKGMGMKANGVEEIKHRHAFDDLTDKGELLQIAFVAINRLVSRKSRL
jgi:hypothetical protein